MRLQRSIEALRRRNHDGRLRAATLAQDRRKARPVSWGSGQDGRPSAGLTAKASVQIFEGKAMKKRPARRNPMAKEIAKPQYRLRIKPDKRRTIEGKLAKRQLAGGCEQR